MTDDDPIRRRPRRCNDGDAQLTVAEALAGQYGAEVVRDGLLVACVTFSEHTLGEQGMRDELPGKVAALLESPAIADAVSKWLH